MTATEAMDKVQAWVGPHPEGKTTGPPDFEMRCAIRKLLRIARVSHQELVLLEQKVAEAHTKVFSA